MTGKMHICSICSVPFKRPAHLKNHLEQQHSTANAILSASGDVDSTIKAFDLSTSSADLRDSNSATLYYSSSPAEIFALEQQLQPSSATAEEADSSVRQCRSSLTSCHNSGTATSANADTSNQTAVVSSVSEMCDHGFAMSDKSVTITPQTLNCLPSSCSASESDVLFSHEHTDSLDENAITDVTATSNAAVFSMQYDSTMLPVNRPDITDGMYLQWHVQFADAMCSTTVPLAGDQLQAVTSVWSSLVSDMTTMMTDATMSGQRQHYPALFDVLRKLNTLVESHLQMLQSTGTC